MNVAIEKIKQTLKGVKKNPLARMVPAIDEIVVDVVGLLEEFEERIELVERHVFSADTLKLPGEKDDGQKSSS